MNALFINYIKGTASGIVAALLLSLTAGIAFQYTPLKEAFLPAFSLIIIVISTFFAGMAAAYSWGSKGLIHGILQGIIFFLLVLILTLVMGNNITLSEVLKKLLFCIAGGAMGGIFGITK